MEHPTDSTFLRYLLAHSSPEYHDRLIQNHIRLGNAAIALCEAQEEYMAAIMERLELNDQIRRGQ